MIALFRGTDEAKRKSPREKTWGLSFSAGSSPLAERNLLPEQHTTASDPPVKGKFALLEFIAATSAKLTRTEIRVLLALALRANSTTWSCWPSQTTIAADIGEPNPESTGRDKVSVAIGGLRRKGIIETAKRTGRGSLSYTVIQGKQGILEKPGIPEKPSMSSKEIQGGDPGKSKEGIPEKPSTEQVMEQETEKEKEQVTNQELFGIDDIKDTKPDPVLALFKIWQESTGKLRTKLDAERRKWIKHGIKEWGQERATQALRGLAKDDFAMGDNDRSTAYNEPRHVFSKAERAEHFMGLAVEPVKSGLNVDQLMAEWMSLYLAAMDRIWETPSVDGWVEFRGTKTEWIADVYLMQHRINHSAAILAGKVMIKRFPESKFICDREIKGTALALKEVFDREKKANA